MSQSESNKQGRLFVISAPSGAGKTTLVRELTRLEPALRFSVSYTTRHPRRGERDGEDYVFVSTDEFRRMIDDGEFLEYARVFDNYYGTARSQAAERMAEGHDVLLEIDWQGARQVREAMPECISIFILPPSRAELERRLRGRGTDPGAVIERRLREAREELSHWDEFDYVIINDDLERARDELHAIIRGEGGRLRAGRDELREVADELLA